MLLYAPLHLINGYRFHIQSILKKSLIENGAFLYVKLPNIYMMQLKLALSVS